MSVFWIISRRLVVLVCLLALAACSPDDSTGSETTDDVGQPDAERSDAGEQICEDGDERACGSDEGECSAGTQVCAEGEWGECNGQVGPSSEICSGLDEDCDGVVDNIAPVSAEGSWLDEPAILTGPPEVGADGDTAWAAWGQFTELGEPGDVKLARIGPDGDFLLEPTVLPTTADAPQKVQALAAVPDGVMVVYKETRTYYTMVASPQGDVLAGPTEAFSSQASGLSVELMPSAGGMLLVRKSSSGFVGYPLNFDGTPRSTAHHRLFVPDASDQRLAALPDRYGVLSSTSEDGPPQLHILDHYGRVIAEEIEVSAEQERSYARGLFAVDDGFLAVWATAGKLYLREFDDEGVPRTDVIELQGAQNSTSRADAHWDGRGITAFTGSHEVQVQAWTRDGQPALPAGPDSENRIDLPRHPSLDSCEDCRSDGHVQVRTNAGWVWFSALRNADRRTQSRFSAGPIFCPAREATCGEASESCDGWDRDCDGQIEQRPAPEGTCATGLPGVCAEGGYACAQSGPICVPDSLGEEPTCDGLDNNCNARIDDMPLVEELMVPFTDDVVYRSYITALDDGWQLFWNQRPQGNSSPRSLMTVKLDGNFAMQGSPTRLGMAADEIIDTTSDGQRIWIAWGDGSKVRVQLINDGEPRAQPPVEVDRGSRPRIFRRGTQITVTWDLSNTDVFAGFKVYDDTLDNPSQTVLVGEDGLAQRGLTLAPYGDKWLAVWSALAEPDRGSDSGDKRYLVKAGVLDLDGSLEGTPEVIGATVNTSDSVDAFTVHAAHANIVQRDDGGYWVVWGGQTNTMFMSPAVVGLDSALQPENSPPLVEFRHGGLVNHNERYAIELVDGQLRTYRKALWRHDPDGVPREEPINVIGRRDPEFSRSHMTLGDQGLIFSWAERISETPEEWAVGVGSMVECSLR